MAVGSVGGAECKECKGYRATQYKDVAFNLTMSFSFNINATEESHFNLMGWNYLVP